MNLFDYQLEAIDFLSQCERGYLALDMGLGKTLTSLAAAHKLGSRHILLIAEKNEISNSENFRREIEDYFPESKYINLREEEMSDMIGSNYRYVAGVNPDKLKKLNSGVIHALFDTVIIDEATLAKTTTTDRFQYIYKIVKDIKYVFLLSGTPMMNGAAELYAPLMLLSHPMVPMSTQKDIKNSQIAFERVFAGGHRRQIRNSGKWWLDFVWWNKGANNVRELRYLLRDHFFFKQKEATGIFKKKTRKIEWVDMTFEWIAEYRTAWTSYLVSARKRQVDLENVSDLRNLIENGQCYQINSKWKAQQVARDIASGKYGDQRIVVFTMFLESDRILQDELIRLGVSFRTFEEIKEWKAGDEQVLVGRIKAHGKGGNVPEASTAIFVDMDFVPTNNIQAENRIDRPEQKNNMTIVYYITRGAEIVDTHIRAINQDKIKKINEFMCPLTDEEIAAMPQRLELLRLKFPKDCAILGI